jgi:aminoglycoside phosphotransferase (APT) family kinase protein
MQRDFTPTSEQIRSLVRTVFPSADIQSCVLFAGQHSNLNYDLVLDSPSIEAVLKIYLGVSSQRTPWKETHLLRTLTTETGVPVPRVLRFDDSCDTIPRPWALHTRLPGGPASEIVDKLDDWELESLGYEMGRYLAHIHTVPLSQFGEFLVPEPLAETSEKGYVSAQTSQWLGYIGTEKPLPLETTEALSEAISRAEFLDQKQAYLLHGHYVPQNVIVERGSAGYHVTGILEFERAQGGSPEQDISVLFNWGAENLPTFQKGFLDGYSDYGHLGDRFWVRLRFYQVYVCLQELLTSAHGLQVTRCRRRLADYLASLDN